MAENIFYEAAITYISQGFSIFPLQVKGKKPLTAHGVKDATKDPAIVKGWWQTWPQANIGIATGQVSGGLCVIDMDIDEDKGLNGYKSLRDWQDRHGIISPSWLCKTGRGGYHYYFIADEHIGNRVGVIPGVDIRGDGGYIVAPPSIHPNGNPYEWTDRCHPETTPLHHIDDNIRFLLNKSNNGGTIKYLAPTRIPEGERNHTLFKLACSLQAKGLSDQAIHAAVHNENIAKCSPPLSDKEITIIIKSVQKYEKGKPIYINSRGEASQGQREPIFDLNKDGLIKKTWANMKEAITYDADLYGHIKYNELANSIWVFGELPWEHVNTYRQWKDYDDQNLKSYLEQRYGFSKSDKIMDALTMVANNNRFNPVCDELNNIANTYKPEEYTGAIRKLLPEYMGVEDTDYHFEVMKTFMLGAICRVFHPGCKFDYTIILYGAQGFGKSEFVRRLALSPEWFNDNFNTLDGDKASEKLAGMWILELAELKALKSSKDSESIKAFLTSRYDTYRAPYQRRTEQRPRMCVFAGTTNNMNVFVDKTGNRRFWPIITNKGQNTKELFGNPEQVAHDFRLAWAEAMALYKEAKEQPVLKLSKDMEAEALRMQEQFSEEDYRVGMIQNYLDEFNGDKVCVPQIIENVFNMDVERMTKANRREIQEILENEIEGWHRFNNKDKGRTRCGKYGKQLAFIRDIKDFD